MTQAIRTLHIGNYSKEDLDVIFKFAINLDNKDLIGYFSTNNVISYDNDLLLYIEIIDSLIKVFEIEEKYENCSILMSQKEKAISIISKKTKNYV